MIDERRAAIAEACNRLPFVRWDRFVDHEYGTLIYGWIDRDDGRSDFVTLTFYDDWGWRPEDCSATTSSARYSTEIQELLRGTSEGHLDCERVDEHLGDLVANVVRLA